MTVSSKDTPLGTADLAEADSDERQPEPPNERMMPMETERWANPAGTQAVALLAENEAHDMRMRWSEVQTGFVDEPRRAVEQADALVSEVMKRLAEVFSRERSELEGQWSQGDDISTEDLRLALQRYRSFFDRLLSV